MPRLLLIDDGAAIVELFAMELQRRLGVDVVTVDSFGGLSDALDPDKPAIDVALIDLSVPASAQRALEGPTHEPPRVGSTRSATQASGRGRPVLIVADEAVEHRDGLVAPGPAG
jgi:hypothetical protein